MQKRRTACPVRALAAALGLTLLWQAQASDLQLEPVMVRLSPTARAAVVRLRNHGSGPMYVQVRAFHWEQANGEDQLSATSALRVSPPIQQIEPGQEQIVRVLLAENVAAEREETYRLIVDELPRAATTDRRVQMLIRYSVPVVLQSDDLAPPDLHFSIETADGRTWLEARNAGGRSAKLSELSLKTSAGAAIDTHAGLYGYVLAGRMRRWQLTLPDGTDTASITALSADVNGQAQSYTIEAMH